MEYLNDDGTDEIIKMIIKELSKMKEDFYIDEKELAEVNSIISKHLEDQKTK